MYIYFSPNIIYLIYHRCLQSIPDQDIFCHSFFLESDAASRWLKEEDQPKCLALGVGAFVAMSWFMDSLACVLPKFAIFSEFSE